MLKSLGISIIIHILTISLSGLTGLLPVVHAAITDLTPPIIRHSSPERIIQGEKVVIMAIVEDESAISWVNLWYRAPGRGTYNKIHMEQLDSKTWRVSIEVTKEFKEGIEYYIESVDQLGNGGTDGTEAAPYFAEVRTISMETALRSWKTGEAKSSGRSLWRSPWFWVGLLAVGGVAVAAGGGSSSNSGDGAGTVIVK